MSSIDETNKLCCALNPELVCEACDLKLCHPCLGEAVGAAAENAFMLGQPAEAVGPLYHEKGHCTSGANSFRITNRDLFIFFKDPLKVNPI